MSRSAAGWRAQALQWLRVARRKEDDERAAAVRAGRYCNHMSVRLMQKAHATGGASHA
jgi:hypothetical protein